MALGHRSAESLAAYGTDADGRRASRKSGFHLAIPLDIAHDKRAVFLSPPLDPFALRIANPPHVVSSAPSRDALKIRMCLSILASWPPAAGTWLQMSRRAGGNDCRHHETPQYLGTWDVAGDEALAC